MSKKQFKRRRIVLIIAIIFMISNIGITFGYWASSVAGDSKVSAGDVSIGEFCIPIHTAQEFYDFATSSSSSSTDDYCLSNDIDFSSFTWEYLSAFTSNQYLGTFDGRNYTLSNITMETSVSGTTYLSLFSEMAGGTIKNVKIENYKMGFSTSYYNSSSIQAGIFAGKVTGTGNLIENITIDNADVIGSSTNGAGGLVGQVEADTDLTIKNIKATNLTVLNHGKRAGGLISRAQSGTGTITIEDIDLQGNVATDNAISNTGGIFGTFRNLTGTISRVIVDYIAEGSIDLSDGTISYKSTKYVGGFIGNDNPSSVMTINDAFYTGKLYNDRSWVGSVLGRKKADITLNNVYYSKVWFVDSYTATTSSNVINSTVVNDSTMPSNTWWNSFFVNFSSANSLWTQDNSGRPILIR